jgi:hypothetical protein
LEETILVLADPGRSIRNAVANKMLSAK